MQENYGLCRNGNRIKIDGILNELEFPSEDHAKRFEKIYLMLARQAVEEILQDVVKQNKQKRGNYDIAMLYFRGGGLKSGDRRGRNRIIEEAKRLYELNEDIEFLKEALGRGVKYLYLTS